jgi:GGDEF domain-containing protein
MANGIDVGDALPTLQQGQADARADFNAIGGNATSLPPVAPAPPLRHFAGPVAPKPQALPTDPSPELAAPGSDDELVHDNMNGPPDPKPALAATEDNGDFWSTQTVKHFLRDTFKGTGTEAANAGGRFLAGLGDMISKGVGGAASIVDKGRDALPGHKDGDSRLADSVFDFRKNYILPAIDYWTPERATQTGEGPGSGGAAQAIGGGLEGAAPILAGAAGVPLTVAKSFSDTAFKAIDEGKDAKTALGEGLVDGLVGWLQMKWGVIPTLPMLKRVGTAIGLGEVARLAGNGAKALILKENGHDDEAAKLNPFDPKNFSLSEAAENAVQNAIFGVVGGHKKAETAKAPAAAEAAPAPAPDASLTPAQPTAAAPPADAVPPPAPAAAAKPASTVVDKPSGESSKDLRAQIRDMNDKDTPRTGVLITTDSVKIMAGSKDANAASVQGTLGQARTQGRTLDLPQGTLILKTAKAKAAAEARLKAGEDPQAVIGSVTGAGDGKSPDQTVVVQGQTPTGAVATETAVAPENVPQAHQAVVDQGKTPVITTPEAAVARRMDEISKEKNDPAQMGLMTTPAGKEVAVHVESGAADGFTRVRAIDADGEPSDHTVDVPADRVKVSKPDEAKPSVEATKTPATDAVVEGSKPEAAKVSEAKAEGVPTGPETQSEGGDKPAPSAEDTSPPETLERRVDTKTRKKVTEMSDEERNKALLTHDKSEIPNNRAYEESDKKPVQVSVDLNSLKYVNDTAGHEAGDDMIKKTAKALHEESDGNAYHTGGDEFVVQADTHDKAEEIIQRAKARLKADNIGISHGTGKDLKEADANMNKEKSRQEKAGERAKRGEAPPDLNAPPPAPVVKLKAVKPKSAFDSLPEALETHEAQEQVPQGSKFAAPLAERQDNASAFATVLREAAKAASGKAAPGDIERATKAAQAAERLTEKGQVATAKGQGTGHTKVTALVAEMHKAARALLGTTREGDAETVAPKVAELKAKLNRTKEKLAVKKEAKVDKADMVEVPVNPKYADDIKQPAKAKKAEGPTDHQKKIKQITDKYIWAENGDDAKDARTEVEQYLHEHFADQMTAEKRDEILQLIDKRRVDENPDSERPRRMSDTVEDEEVKLDPTDKYEGMMRGGRELLNTVATKASAIKDAVFGDRLSKEWEKVAKTAGDNGIIRGLAARVDTGEHISSHDFLNRLIASSDGSPIAKSMLQSLRAHAPDLPIYMVSRIKNLNDGSLRGATTAGLFSPKQETIQGRIIRNDGTTIRSLVHEIRHAATAFELQQNPRGELAQASHSALNILVKRLVARYGSESIGAHLAYWEGAGPKPENFKEHLYGIHTPLEMHAELDNPKFLREIAESEKFAQPGEVIPKGRSLLGKIYDAIAKFMGIGDARLLQHIGDLHERVMDTQKIENRALNMRTADERAAALTHDLQSRLGANILEAKKAAGPIDSLRDPLPKPEKNFRDLANVLEEDEKGPVTLTARLFERATKSRALDAVRTVVTQLKGVDQIFRDHRSDFGHPDDKANPLNQLEDVQSTKNILMHKMHEITRPVAESWLKLPEDVNKKLGQLFIDTTSYKIDPRKGFDEQVPEVADDKKASIRHTEYQQRLKALPADAQKVYGDAIDANRKVMRELRKAGVDAALHTFSNGEVTDAQRSLLYGAKSHEIYDQLVGPGKLIDVGEQNDSLRNSLASFAGQAEIQGPYMHLGRTGDYVVTAKPEGSKEFDNRSDAEAFVKNVTDLSPGSKAKYQELGGKHVVDYKADYTSFHESKNDAEQAAREMTKLGLDVGNVTRKTLSKSDVPLSQGASQLLAEAERKITKNGSDEGTKALTDSLRSAFLQLSAARSAYAGSRLARKAAAGVKPEEMRKNFSDYAQSTIWHAAQMRTVFDQASALAKVRGAARDSDPSISQATTYRRGEVVSALNSHMQDEVQSFGHKSPFNSALAKLGFMSYLASPSHAFIWMTQNFSTGIPVAGARWGYGRATSSFMGAMKAVSGPAFRETVSSAFKKGGNSSDVHDAIIKAISADPKWSKWTKGPNSPFQQLIDRGVINHSYSEAMGALARGDSATVARAFEFARLLPNMADAFNRVSTALAGLEMTGGDIRKTADFVREIHADYSQENKPLLFKKLGRVPGGNSVTMFKTYVQAMAHLLYGNVKDSFASDRKLEAAKTVAGMVVGTALFAGVFKAAALEPIRLAVYAYHKAFDQEGEGYDLQNQVHKWLVDAMGKQGGNLAAYGLPHAAGFDLSSRMGLSDLFFHDMPDLLSGSKDNWKNFVYQESGTMTSFIADRVTGFMGHMQKGEPGQAVSALVPIKQYQDAVKAYELATTGKQNSLGGQMTEPSMGDAAWQLLGLKPASVAEAQEHGSVSANFRTGLKDTRAAIIKAYVAGDKSDALERVNNFNRMHPAEAIKGRELRSEEILKQRIEQGGPGRDTDLNERQDF